MQVLWTEYGLFLWAFTTMLVIIALLWLAWNTFGAGPTVTDKDSAENRGGSPELSELEERLNNLSETMPYIQGTLGRTLQYYNLIQYTDAMGAQAFSLAVASARGDGFVVSTSVRGGLTAKALIGWESNQSLTAEERSAVQQAQTKKN